MDVETYVTKMRKHREQFPYCPRCGRISRRERNIHFSAARGSSRQEPRDGQLDDGAAYDGTDESGTREYVLSFQEHIECVGKICREGYPDRDD